MNVSRRIVVQADVTTDTDTTGTLYLDGDIENSSSGDLYNKIGYGSGETVGISIHRLTDYT